VGVVEKSAFLVDGEFVGIRFARAMGVGRKERGPVDGDFEPCQCMEVLSGQSVFDHDADAIALRDLDRGAGHEPL